MNIAELQALVAQGVSEQLEFKSSTSGHGRGVPWWLKLPLSE